MAAATSQENHRVVPLPNQRDEREVLDRVAALGRKHGIHEILPIRVGDICVAEWVRLKCRYGCKKYGSSWCCAPETPDPEKVREILKEYETALLLAANAKSQEFYRDNQKKRRKQVNSWKGTIALERKLFLEGYYKAFALMSESCALCRDCAYPEACRFPANKRPSVESFSIDVFQTLKNVGKSFDLARDVRDEYNRYSIILLE